MKALVLSGGIGTRLRPLTHTIPKQLVPIANTPVLFLCLQAIRAARIEEVGIVVGDHADQIRAAVGGGAAFGQRITYIEQELPLGLAHCVQIAGDYLGSDDFLMFLGDNVFVQGIAAQAAAFRAAKDDAHLLLSQVGRPSEYGIAITDAAGRVRAIEEKPVRPRGDHAVTGAYFFRPVIHEAVRRIKPSDRGELEITDAIQWLIEQGAEVRAQVYSGDWKDTGRVDDLLDCNRLLLEETAPHVDGEIDARTEIIGPVAIEAGARVLASRVHGPVVIGAGTVVTNSDIGQWTALGRSCAVTDAGVADSIVLDGSSISGIQAISRSVLGRYSHVTAGNGARHGIVIGDDSHVVITT